MRHFITDSLMRAINNLDQVKSSGTQKHWRLIYILADLLQSEQFTWAEAHEEASMVRIEDKNSNFRSNGSYGSSSSLSLPLIASFGRYYYWHNIHRFSKTSLMKSSRFVQRTAPTFISTSSSSWMLLSKVCQISFPVCTSDGYSTESARLYPPVPTMYVRQAVESDVIGELEIPKGVSIDRFADEYLLLALDYQ